MFTPHLNILPAAQQAIWPLLQETPAHFVLYGGTAIALRLGHRESVDFDFFSNEPFVPEMLLSSISYLKNAKPMQSSPNTLVCQIDTKAGPVKISFFGNLTLKHVSLPEQIVLNQIWVAGLLDLAATKLKVIQNRAEFKDYFDLGVLLKFIPLPEALSAAQCIYGPSFNPLLSIKALGYFEDGDLQNLSNETKIFFKTLIKKLDLNTLPSLVVKPGLL